MTLLYPAGDICCLVLTAQPVRHHLLSAFVHWCSSYLLCDNTLRHPSSSTSFLPFILPASCCWWISCRGSHPRQCSLPRLCHPPLPPHTRELKTLGRRRIPPHIPATSLPRASPNTCNPRAQSVNALLDPSRRSFQPNPTAAHLPELCRPTYLHQHPLGGAFDTPHGLSRRQGCPHPAFKDSLEYRPSWHNPTIAVAPPCRTHHHAHHPPPTPQTWRLPPRCCDRRRRAHG